MLRRVEGYPREKLVVATKFKPRSVQLQVAIRFLKGGIDFSSGEEFHL